MSDDLGKPYENRFTCPVCRASGKDIKWAKKRKLPKISFVLVSPEKNVCKKCGFEFYNKRETE